MACRLRSLEIDPFVRDHFSIPNRSGKMLSYNGQLAIVNVWPIIHE